MLFSLHMTQKSEVSRTSFMLSMSQSKSFPIGFWQRVFLVAPLFPKWGHRSGWIHIFYLTQILYQVLLFFVFVFCYITIPFIQTWDQHLDYHMPPEPGFVSAPGIGTIQTTTLWGHLFSIDSHVKIPHFTSIKKGLQPRTKYIWPLWIFSPFKPTKQGLFFHILQ